MATPLEPRKIPKDPTLDVERALFAAGARLVIALDEVGRGAIAGPVAVGAHVTIAGTARFPEGLRDSKLLSEKRRDRIAGPVSEWGDGAVGYATAPEIDENGIVWALGHAARRALVALSERGIPADGAVILLDGSHDWLSPVLRAPLDVITMPGADRTCASVAAASVRAKVERDAAMRSAHEQHPVYGWASNKGYGARVHYEGIASHGLTAHHRRSFIH